MEVLRIGILWAPGAYFVVGVSLSPVVHPIGETIGVQIFPPNESLLGRMFLEIKRSCPHHMISMAAQTLVQRVCCQWIINGVGSPTAAIISAAGCQTDTRWPAQRRRADSIPERDPLRGNPIQVGRFGRDIIGESHPVRAVLVRKYEQVVRSVHRR